MTPNQKLNTVKAELQALVPTAYITRSYEELNTKADSHEVIYAIVSGGFPQFGEWMHTDEANHQFMIVAQQQVSEDVTGEQKEAMEFAMLDVVRTLVQQDSAGTNIEIIKAHQSRQMDPTQAWIVAELQFNDL